MISSRPGRWKKCSNRHRRSAQACHGLPAWASILVVASTLVILVTLLVALIGSSISKFNSKLPDYQARVEQEVARVEGWWDARSESFRTWFDELTDGNSRGQDENKSNEQAPVDAVPIAQPIGQPIDQQGTATSKTAPWTNAQSIFSFVSGTLTSLAGVLSNAFLILITVIFMLLEAATFPAKIRAMPGDSSQSLDNLDKIVATINQYMAIKTLTSLLTGVLIAAWLTFFGVDFALLWGLLAFLLNYVPNIGSILAAVPAVLLAFIQLGAGGAAWVGLGFVLVNTLIGYAIEPRFMGKGLGLSTLVVFVSLVFWGWALGPVGMLLSVPLTMTAKITLESNEETRWIAILLGTESDASAAVALAGPDSVEELIDIDQPPAPSS